MERIVIVAYKPLAGKEAALKNLVKEHWDILNSQGLVSERKPVICQAADGTLIEIFGWKSKDAIEMAHTNTVVQELWGEFAHLCEYIPVGQVAESSQIFSEFSPAGI